MYSVLHMENMLEIGRCIQFLFDKKEIEHYDSKEVFDDALKWAEEFEEKCDFMDGDYYDLICEFVKEKLKEKFDN